MFLVAQAYLPANQANGTFGPKTQAALVKFQTAQKLPATGLPDPATVVRALVEMKPS
jgi:peptidoglycan hydrolase-like protein with peptidoglycan-binding domain